MISMKKMCVTTLRMSKAYIFFTLSQSDDVDGRLTHLDIII